jgi:hypothetical protein
VLEGPIPTTTFRVEPPAGEMERIPMNEPELIRAATLTGGKFYTPETTAHLLDQLPRPEIDALARGLPHVEASLSGTAPPRRPHPPPPPPPAPRAPGRRAARP